MRQTAIDWFAKELYEKFEMKGDGNLFDELFIHYKEMEKQQMKDAWDASDTNMRNQFSSSAYKGITFNQWDKNK